MVMIRARAASTMIAHSVTQIANGTRRFRGMFSPARGNSRGRAEHHSRHRLGRSDSFLGAARLPPGPTSVIGEPGWCALHKSSASRRLFHRLDVGSGDNEVAFDEPHGERGHRDPSTGSTKCAPQRSQFEPILEQPGAARSWSRSGIARSAPCKAVSSSRLYAAFQSHLVQSTMMVAHGSSRSW